MKATGFIELVVIMAALVVGLPLLLMTITAANTMTTSYIEDKSTWHITADIEYEVNDRGVLVPKTIITPQQMSLAQAAVLAYVQDEYSPDSSRKFDYNYDATSLMDDTNPDYNITIPPHSRGYRYENGDCIEIIAPKDTLSSRVDKSFYYVYNPVRKSWMITNEFIDVLGY